jgi:hypothetical protein
VLRERREATTRLLLGRADCARAAAGTDDDGNDVTPGLCRMRARLRRGRASEPRARRPRAAGRNGEQTEGDVGHAPRANAAAPGVEMATLAMPSRRGARFQVRRGARGHLPWRDGGSAVAAAQRERSGKNGRAPPHN